MSELALRDATRDDIELLRSLASDFGQGHPESPALRSWMDPAWDFGVVAVDEAGAEVGAAWCRAFRAVVLNGELNPELREPFFGVIRERRRAGLGGRLLDALIDRAAKEDVMQLVGRVVQGDQTEQVEGMLRRRGFARDDMYRSRGLGMSWRFAFRDKRPPP